MLSCENFFLFALVTVGAWGANICGTVGIHNSSKTDYYMGNFFYKGPSIFTLCASYCKKDFPKCRSFRYSYWGDAAGQYCEFFDNGLEGNMTADDTQPYYYYDVGCNFPSYADNTSTVTSRVGGQTTTQVQYQTQIATQTITTTSIPPASTQTQTISVTTTSRPPAITQTTTQTQRVNQTSTTTFTQPAHTSYSTLTETSPTTVTIARTTTITSNETLARSTVTSVRSFTITSTSIFILTRGGTTATRTSIRSTTITSTVTRQQPIVLAGAGKTVMSVRTMTTTKRLV